MKINQIKFLATVIALVSVFAIVAFNTTDARSVSEDIHTIASQDDVAAAYKKQCAMCHTAKADKFFNPSKSMESHIEAVLKGRPDSKPPMPGFGSKGMKEEQAKALVEYMIQLKNPKSTDSGVSSDANSNTSGDANKSAFTAEQVAASYKTKCAMCHSPKAEKAFDPSKADDVLVEVVLKGKPSAKPPMPGYESKGMKSDEALALVAYMKGLRDAKKSE